MQITDIKVRKLFDEGPMKAIISVTFDGQLAVHDIKVIYAREKYLSLCPAAKIPMTPTVISYIPSTRSSVGCWRTQ